MRTEKVSFMSEGQKISGVLHLPDGKNPLCVIASHGLLSSKDSEKYIALGESFPRRGWPCSDSISGESERAKGEWKTIR
jgi:hypothetical protein